MQRAFAAALIVQKEWLAVAQHDVARLEIPIEKVIVRRAQQEFRQPAEIVFQRLFVEGNAGEPQKVILEIVQVPGDGLAIEAGARIAHFVIQVAAGFDLKARQHRHNFAIGFHRRRSNVFAATILRQKLEERRVAEVFFEIGAVVQIFAIDFRHGQTMPAKMPGKFKKGDVLFAHVVQNADRAESAAGQPDDLAPRAAELALQRLHLLGRRVEMLLKKLFRTSMKMPQR